MNMHQRRVASTHAVSPALIRIETPSPRRPGSAGSVSVREHTEKSGATSR